jgi:ribonuclease G
MISITGGERYVGEKHMVRIEEAGRTAAVASLVDVSAPAADGASGRGSEDSSGDALESGNRRRGRRGGRRRSGARTESASAASTSD